MRQTYFLFYTKGFNAMRGRWLFSHLLHQTVRTMGYKNPLDLFKKRSSQSPFPTIYLFSEYIFKLSFFSLLKRYLFKYQRVLKFTKKNPLQISSTNHRLLWLERVNQIDRTNKLTDHPWHKSHPKVF